MPARNAGNTWRFESVAIEDPCHMQCNMAARHVGNTLQFEDVAIKEQDAAFNALSASSAGSPEFPAIAQSSHGKRGRAVCNAAAHNTAQQAH